MATFNDAMFEALNEVYGPGKGLTEMLVEWMADEGLTWQGLFAHYIAQGASGASLADAALNFWSEVGLGEGGGGDPEPDPDPPTISGTPPEATQGVFYDFTYTVTDATSAEITAGALPAGVTLNPSTFRFTGVPSESGTFNFTVEVTGPGGTDEIESELVVAGATTPSVVGTPTGHFDTTGTSHTVTYPNDVSGGIQAGDIITIAVTTYDHAGSVGVTAPGFYHLGHYGRSSGNRVWIDWLYRVADGSEGESVTVTTSTSIYTVKQCWVVRGAVAAAVHEHQVLGQAANGSAACTLPGWAQPDLSLQVVAFSGYNFGPDEVPSGFTQGHESNVDGVNNFFFKEVPTGISASDVTLTMGGATGWTAMGATYFAVPPAVEDYHAIEANEVMDFEHWLWQYVAFGDRVSMSADGTALRNCTIEAPTSTSPALVIDASDIVVEDVDIRNAAEGVRWTSGDSLVMRRLTVAEGVFITEEAHMDALQAFLPGSNTFTNFLVEDCVFDSEVVGEVEEGWTPNGSQLAGWNNVDQVNEISGVFRRCHFGGGGAVYALRLYDVEDVTLEECTFDDFTSTGYGTDPEEILPGVIADPTETVTVV